MSNDGLFCAVGLAQKAGKCVSGTDAVERAVKSGGVALLLIDAGMSRRTRDDWLRKSEGVGIRTVEFEGVGASIGRPGRMVAAITDEAFAWMICGKVCTTEAYSENHGGVEQWQK